MRSVFKNPVKDSYVVKTGASWYKHTEMQITFKDTGVFMYPSDSSLKWLGVTKETPKHPEEDLVRLFSVQAVKYARVQVIFELFSNSVYEGDSFKLHLNKDKTLRLHKLVFKQAHRRWAEVKETSVSYEATDNSEVLFHREKEAKVFYKLLREFAADLSLLSLFRSMKHGHPFWETLPDCDQMITMFEKSDPLMQEIFEPCLPKKSE